ncbi:hypothetical protein BKA65DRAFT_514703 [Rhexocercosporidium sp. MPI-PUGE-AT-0058]|nr:hypothetical protein BKA65DRAFT_514703 [Rhexocercosporidium sp. MPI-PUGE-AT-0058]
MASNELRVQLLANLRWLYGSKVEVLTLCLNNASDNHQAIAMSFDPFSLTWTKFLHSKPHRSSTGDAIHSLLMESERELTNFLSVNGSIVPFQGDIQQTITLSRGQSIHSSAGNSMRSEAVVGATRASTLPDPLRENLVPVEYSVEVSSSDEPLANQNPVQEADVEDRDEMPLAPESVPVPEEPVPEEPRPTSPEFDHPTVKEYSAEEEPPRVEDYPAEIPGEEPAPEPVDYDWGSFSISKKNKRKGKHFIDESDPPPAPAPEPVVEMIEEKEDDFGWGLSSVSKKEKKKSKYLIEDNYPLKRTVEEPVVEVVEKAKEDFEWGFLSVKKKTKKSKYLVDKNPPLEEVREEPVGDFGWGSSGSSWASKKNKKKAEITLEKEEICYAEPSADDLNWTSLPTSKKKNNETLTREDRHTSPRLEPVEHPVEECREFELEEPPETLSAPSPLHDISSESGLRIQDSLLRAGIPEAEFPLELEVQSYQPVVFTIRFPDETSSEPLQAMTTMAENSRAAMIDPVNSYLDSEGMLKGTRRQRKIVIKYGVGRNGNVDLSTLGDAKWPEYLNYFRQYTRIPELTVDVTEY